MPNTRYIYLFVFAMTSVVALALSLLYTALKPIHLKNEALYAKRAILAALGDKLDGTLATMSNDDVQSIFDTRIEQLVVDVNGNILTSEETAARAYGATIAEEIDMGKQRKKPVKDRVLPVYIYTAEDGSKYYIVSMRGNGLWDEIWGNIALKDDLKTIAGVDFDHKGETPGLGAEIKDNKQWKNQFIGKTLYDENRNFTSVTAVKGGARNDINQVDGISGATITADGVNDMFKNWIPLYESFFAKL